MMIYKVKEAIDEPGIFWIENEAGVVFGDLYRMAPYCKTVPYPDAKANAELFCKALNQREETK